MSKKDTKKELSASNLRIILSLSLAVILLAMAGGFYFAYSFLHERAVEVSKTQSEASSSDAQIRQLISLEEQLKKNQSAVKKARQIVAESQSYQYQNQIINDLTTYANQAGISISAFNFQDTAAAASPTAPTPPSTGDQSAANQPPTTPSPSLKSTSVSVQLAPNIRYQNLLHFVHLIEQNLTRMQISELSLTKGESNDTVGAQTLNIEVYIR